VSKGDGTCSGYCCDDFSLTVPPSMLPPETRGIFHLVRVEFLAARWVYTCDWFDKAARRCRHYEKRPKWCRDYGVLVPCEHAGCTWKKALRRQGGTHDSRLA